jgi:hypothetical protein
MSASEGRSSCSSPLVYGFLCEQTNVFYAFETQEEYLAFLDWLQGQSGEPATAEAVSDEEMLRNSDRATRKIMEVFEDPVFKEGDYAMEME